MKHTWSPQTTALIPTETSQRGKHKNKHTLGKDYLVQDAGGDGRKGGIVTGHQGSAEQQESISAPLYCTLQNTHLVKQYLMSQSNTMCHKAIPCVTKQYLASQRYTLYHKAISCITKQNLASQSNTLHHKAIPCFTKQYLASHHKAIPCITKQYLTSQSNTLLH